MNRNVIMKIKELACYFLIVLFLSVIVKKLGLSDTSIFERAICLTIGWGIWQIVSFYFKKKKRQKTQ